MQGVNFTRRRNRLPSNAQVVGAALICAAILTTCRQAPQANRTEAAQPSATPSSDQTLWITADGLRLKLRVYQSAKLGKSPVLVLVLHGDSPFAPPSYQYAFARKLAAQMDNLVVAALLRPGYTDDTGERSGGKRGLATGDNYTPEVVDAVVKLTDELKARFHPACTVLVGHSGGAAIAADVLGRWPSEVNAALLVSCPCDLKAWRRHMLKVQSNPIWLLPVTSISPLDVAGKVLPSVRVRMIVGSEDNVAPPAIAQQYADALRNRGGDANITIAPGLKHDILLEPVTFEQSRLLLQDCERRLKN